MEQQAGRTSTALAGYHPPAGQARMRKWAALALAIVAGVVLIGCQEAATGTGSSSTGGTSSTPTGGTGSTPAGAPAVSSPISPPSWIIGTWRDATLSWTFTVDNVVRTSSTSSFNFRQFARRNAGVTVSDTSPSETQYQITLDASDIGTNFLWQYDFRKAGSDAIEYYWTVHGVGVAGPFFLNKHKIGDAQDRHLLSSAKVPNWIGGLAERSTGRR